MQDHESQPKIKTNSITLDDIRRYYFENTKRTLQVEDAKYLLDRSLDMHLDRDNGGVQALFSSLKYKFGNE